ncbi:AraC family transcriptional regulator [Nitrospirillum amazonense]|uniref:AraC family transcriptional regulator n=2 Tax=Nitrospirillum amazonense TaxID=28077 RepID=A0A560J4J8_9PROT|nr:AraC family transcriptional regulator [Nitrospirillum amazonense]TWB18433.1 AraC family transcriptional regulator [Nitrospirillum amazonense]TWB66046.1 AraC family transcriptional regulator [Nitrospirillum amazonense]
MDRYLFVDFMADALPAGITTQRRIRQRHLIVGQYTLDRCHEIRFGSPQFLLLQNDGPPHTLTWHTPGNPTPNRQHVKLGEINIIPPETILYASWPEQISTFIVALTPNFVVSTLKTFPPSRIVAGAGPWIGIDDPMLLNISAVLRGRLDHRSHDDSTYLPLAGNLLITRAYELFAGHTVRQPLAAGGLGLMRQRHILAFIDGRLQESLTLCRLAREAGLSPDHFGRAFRISVGLSPLQYITQRRISMAKEALLTPNRTITDIAMALGFASPSHFSDAFRKATGVAPSKWRRERN